MRLDDWMKKAVLAACAGTLLMLAACGGDDYHPPSTDSSAGNGGNGGTTTPPADMVDTFLASVLSLIGVTSDTAEPVSTDSLTATAPETTEPTKVN